MTNMNVSNSTLRALNTQQARTLVNDILGSDGVVDKTDKDKLKELQTLLETAAKEGDDGSIDSEEDGLIDALTDHHYILGVNAGTSEAYLSQNLKEIQKAQQSAGSEATEVSFDGVKITTDGLFSDDLRVIRLRDALPTDSTGGTTPSTTNSESSGTTTNAEPDAPSQNSVSTPSGAPGNSVTPIAPVPTYTSAEAPAALPAPAVVDANNASQLGAQVNTYNQSVTALQTEVRNVRDMLNDPQQVSNEQLRTGIQNLADKDPARAIQQLARLNGYTDDKQMLDAMKAAGTISATDVSTLQEYLADPGKFSQLPDRSLDNGEKASTAIQAFLSKNPLSEPQLNGYRASLVSTADNYLRNPSPQNQAAVSSELYDNNYVFSTGASPAQEEAYQRLYPALGAAKQSLENISNSNNILNGSLSVLNPSSGPAIQTGQDMSRSLGNTSAASQEKIQSFSNEINKTLSYLKENPDQYPGQSADVAGIEAKMQSLNAAQTPQEKARILHSIAPALDELQEKTNLSQGAAGVDTSRLVRQLGEIAASPDSTQQTRDAVNFLTQYPELLQAAPQLSDYSEILKSLDRPPMSTNPLTEDQKALKTALQSGDVAKVNQLYLNEMFSSFSLNLGGLFGFGGSLFGQAAAVENSPLAPTANSTPPERLPGNWTVTSSLAATLQNATPARRQEIMTALRSPQAESTAQAIQSNPELQRVVETYSRAQAANTSMQNAYLSSDSSYDSALAAVQSEQNLQPNVQIELNNARTAIDSALAQGDLAPAVKDKLTAQKAAIDKALGLMEQGKFDEAAASAPDMKALDDVLRAISTNTGDPRLPVGLVLQREATIQALSEATADKANMQKLEEALKDNPAYAHIFAKDGEGNYKFPGQLTELLQSEDLTPDALALLLNQSNRAIEVIDSAKTRNVETLKANYAKGKEMHEKKDGKQHDFYSGFIALESMNTILDTSEKKGYLKPVDILNGIAQQQDVQSILNNPDQAARRDALTAVMREDNIQLGTDQAQKQNIDNYVNSVNEFRNSTSAKMLDNIFADTPEGKEGRAVLDQHLSQLTPKVDTSQIKSKEDLFRVLSADQLSALQKSISEVPYSPERKAIEDERNSLIARVGNAQPPLVPAYDPKAIYDTSKIEDPAMRGVVDRLNTLNRTSAGVNTLNDTIKDIFSGTEITGVVSARGEVTANVSKDVRTQVGTTLQTLEGDINRTPGFQAYLAEHPLPPKPQNRETNPNYDNEMIAYSTALASSAKAYLEKLPAPPGVEHARLDTIIQGAENLGVLSDVAFRIDSGGEIDSDLLARFHVSMTKTNLLANLSGSLANASGPAEAQSAVATYRSDLATYGINLQQAIAETGGDSSETIGALTTGPGGTPTDTGVTPTGTGGPSTTGTGGRPRIGTGAELLALHVSTDGMSSQGKNAVAAANEAVHVVTAFFQDRREQVSLGNPPDRQPPFDEMSTEEIQQIANQAPPMPSAVEMLQGSIQRAEDIYAQIPPEDLVAVGQDMQASMQTYNNSFTALAGSMEKAVGQLNEIRQSEGLPPLTRADGTAYGRVGGASQATAGDQKASQLVAKANELADKLVLAPKGADSDALLTDLITDFLDIIRDQDYKTRQLVLAQLANQMMTDTITNFYKDKTDKNNKYHQDALADMAASFEQSIQKSIQSSLVASASGSDAQSVAAISGQVGAAGTAEAMSVAQLRSTTEQLLSQAQQIEPPLITNQQKEQILNSLFDNDPNNDALGIMALAGLQSVN